MSSSSVLRLYREMLRSAAKFDNYNFRCYAVRRVKEDFRKNKTLEPGGSEQEKVLEFARQQVDVLYRQMIVSKLYPPQIKSVMETIVRVEDQNWSHSFVLIAYCYCVEFLKITKDERTGGAQTHGEGVKVLGKTIVKSGASSVAKITGSLDKFVGEFSDDNKGDISGGDDASILVAGLSSGAGETGFSVLMYAAKRFQINVTPSVLKTCRALMDALDEEAQQNGLQKHQDSFRLSVSAKKQKETHCLVQNFTGCKVSLKLNGTAATRQ